MKSIGYHQNVVSAQCPQMFSEYQTRSIMHLYVLPFMHVVSQHVVFSLVRVAGEHDRLLYGDVTPGTHCRAPA